MQKCASNLIIASFSAIKGRRSIGRRVSFAEKPQIKYVLYISLAEMFHIDINQRKAFQLACQSFLKLIPIPPDTATDSSYH